MKCKIIKMFCIVLISTLMILSGCGEKRKNVAKIDHIEKTDIKNSTKDDSIDEEIDMDELTESNEQVQEKSIFADSESFEERTRTAMATLEIWDGSIAESFDGGDGSEDNPYQIRNGAQLAKLAQDTNNRLNFSGYHFVLTSDIMLNDISNWEEIANDKNNRPEWNSWYSIGQETLYGAGFEGCFDGCGFTIYGLYSEFNREQGVAAGLFGYVDGGTVSNLNLAYTLLRPCFDSKLEHLGGVVGNLNSGSIENCHGKQIVIDGSRELNYDRFDIGGICGKLGNAEVLKCSTEGKVYCASYRRDLNIGGILGRANYERAKINSCLNMCKVFAIADESIPTNPKQYFSVGGICGYGGSIQDCYNIGDLEIAIWYGGNDSRDATVAAGGIVGQCKGCVEKCGSYGIVNASYVGHSNDKYTSGITAYLGGIAGIIGNEEDSRNNWISSCYSDMEINTIMDETSFNTDGTLKITCIGVANENAKGIVGCINRGESIKDCYYNKNYDPNIDSVIERDSHLWADMTMELSEEEMCKRTGFNNWDFNYESQYKIWSNTMEPQDIESVIDPSGYYDYLLCSGGGYFLVSKQVESVTNIVEYIGVLDENYNWVVPLSDNSYINPDGKLQWVRGRGYMSYEEYCKYVADALLYAGNGVFVIGQSGSENSYSGENAVLFNVLKNTWTEIGNYDSIQSIADFDNYYVAVRNNDVVLINLENGAQETSIYCKSYIYTGQYSEGMFFAYDGFYDINENKVIDLSEYAGLIINNPQFVDGECELIAKNENGTRYKAVIDLNGNFISEFAQIDN